jgi:hypothetical protein
MTGRFRLADRSQRVAFRQMSQFDADAVGPAAEGEVGIEPPASVPGSRRSRKRTPETESHLVAATSGLAAVRRGATHDVVANVFTPMSSTEGIPMRCVVPTIREDRCLQKSSTVPAE